MGDWGSFFVLFVDILAGNDESEFSSVISKYLYDFFTEICQKQKIFRFQER